MMQFPFLFPFICFYGTNNSLIIKDWIPILSLISIQQFRKEFHFGCNLKKYIFLQLIQKIQKFLIKGLHFFGNMVL